MSEQLAFTIHLEQERGYEFRVKFDSIGHLGRCMEQFEDFCIVTESIRHGIPVSVKVVDAAGRTVHDSAGNDTAAA